MSSSSVQTIQYTIRIPYQPSLKENILYCVQRVWEAIKNFFSSCCPPRIREFFIGSERESQIRLQELQQEVAKYRTGVPLTARQIEALQKKKNAADAVFKRAVATWLAASPAKRTQDPAPLEYSSSQTEARLNILLNGGSLAKPIIID